MDKLSMDQLQRRTVAEFKEAEKLPIVVVLDNVRSMHNVGSVFRTADGFLIEAICLCGFTPRPPHRDIQKTALGATETVQWKGYDTTIDAVKELKERGYRIIGVEQVKQSILLHQIKIEADERLAVIFGNEVEGVSQEVLELCDACVEIPQFGMKHSLNVSVATGIVLWEFVSTFIKNRPIQI